MAKNKTINLVKSQVIYKDYSKDAERTALVSGENLAHMFGKIARWYTDISWVGHTHTEANITDFGTYAGASTKGGAATSANKLNIGSADIGSETKPVYFSYLTGKPVACTYSLNASVPANAVFTDINVKQSPSTANESREVLFAGNTGNTETTGTVGKSNKLYFNPSTGALTATSFSGSVAASNLTGTIDVGRLPTTAVTAGSYGPAAGGTLTYGGTFDVPYVTVDKYGRLTGASTKTFTMPAQYTHPTYTSKTSAVYKITVDNLGHVSAATSATAADVGAMAKKGSCVNGANYNDFNTTGFFEALGNSDNPTQNAPNGNNTNNNFYVITQQRAASYFTQIATSVRSDKTMYIRSYTNSTWSDWVEMKFTDTVYVHPTYTEKANGLYKITVDATGHVSATAAVTASDLPAHTHDYAGSNTPGGSANRALQSNNCWVDVTNPSTNTKYGIVFVTDPNVSEDNTLRKTDAFRVNHFLGAAGTEGITEIVLGNNVASSAANNSSGHISVYNSNGKFTELKPGTNSTDIRISLPSAEGTLALVGDNNHTHNYVPNTKAGIIAGINLLESADGTPVDGTYYISQHNVSDGSNTNYYRRTHLALWNYIKGKADSVYAPKSHSHSYLPLSGGTMTGAIILPKDKYGSDECGLNCNNSNIINANNIKFGDTPDTDGSEGIHYYRSATTWDSLWGKDGVLYFTPNFPSGTTHYTIYHSGNLTYSTIDAASSSHTHGLLDTNLQVSAPNNTTDSWASINAHGTGFVLRSIRTQANAAPYMIGNYSAGIVFGGADTRGVITHAYDTPSVKFAGGNRTAADGGTARWYFTLNATTGQSYTLPSTGGTLTDIIYKASNYYATSGHTHSYAKSESINGPAYSVAGWEGTDALYRHVWFSTSTDETRRAYNDNFMCSPTQGTLKFTGWIPIDLTGKTDNLNSYNDSTGVYRYYRCICTTTGGGSNITNKPADSPFVLEVILIRWASSSDYITKQIYHGYDKKTYQRFCTNGTWSTWTEQKYTDTVYTHPTHTQKASGLYKITVDSLGHVSGAAAVTASDLPSHTHNYVPNTEAGVIAGINLLREATAIPVDDCWYISQENDATTTNFYKRKHSALWSYIKSKADSVYAAASHTHSYLPLAGGTMSGLIIGGRGYTHLALGTNSYTNDYGGLEKLNNVDINTWWGFSVSNACTGVGTLNQVAFSVNARTGNVYARTGIYVGSTKVSLEGHTHNYAGSSTAGGDANRAVQSNNCKVDVTDPSSSTTYGLVFVVDPNTTEDNTLRKSNNFRINHFVGAANTEGIIEIVMGNTTAKTAANNSTGRIAFYNSNGKYTVVTPGTGSSNITVTLPTSGGTLALVGDNNHTHKYAGSSTAGGDATRAVNSNNCATTVTNASSGTNYGIVFVADPGVSEDNALRKTYDFRLYHWRGAANTEGITELVLGNSTPKTSDKNSSGMLSIYNGMGYHTDINSALGTANITITLPSTGGNMTNVVYKTGKTLSSVSHSGWTNATTDNAIVPTMSFIAYWNGAYDSSGNSNLAYCNKGAFGTIITKGTGDYVANTAEGVSGGINKLTTGTSTPVDADYYVAQWVNGGTTTTTYVRRTHSALWSYIKDKADSVYAAASHSHSYLPLSGGTMTGNLSLTEAKSILLRPNHSSYTAGIGYDTSGNECIGLWAKNSTTRLRWHAGTDMTTMTSGTMMGITPDFEISKASGSASGYIGGNAIIIATDTSVSQAINKLSTGTSTPSDNDYYVAQYANGGTATTSYHRRLHSALFSYINSKLYKILWSGSTSCTARSSTSITLTTAIAANKYRFIKVVWNCGSYTGSSEFRGDMLNATNNVPTGSDATTTNMVQFKIASDGKSVSVGPGTAAITVLQIAGVYPL